MKDSTPFDAALEFYVPAKGFKEMVKLLEGNQHAAINPALFFLPTQTLIGFAFELYFKSWLAYAGISKSILKSKYGHDLKHLHADCISSGLPTIRRLDETVEATADSHSDYTYRYFSQDREYRAMGLMTVYQVLDGLDEAVDARIGASGSMGLMPGH